MAVITAFDQVNGGSVQVGLAALPANSTLIKARLACYTWFNSFNTGHVFQEAPPNTLLGLELKPAGQSPELITTANWKDGTWYMAGVGELVVMDNWQFLDTSVTPNLVTREQVFSQVLELENPTLLAASTSPGISINWLGFGFYSNDNAYLSYQFTAWYE